MNQFLLGAIAACCFLICVLLLRAWRKSDDRLFLLFALAFGLEGINRTVLASTATPNEGNPIFYLVRLASFVIILIAIADKNLSRSRK